MVNILKILPYINWSKTIALSNLTGSPEGPGFPGFPLAPCNEKKSHILKLQHHYSTSELISSLVINVVCAEGLASLSYIKSRGSRFSNVPFISCITLVIHKDHMTEWTWNYGCSLLIHLQFSFFSRSVLTGSPLGPGGPSGPGVPCEKKFDRMCV